MFFVTSQCNPHVELDAKSLNCAIVLKLVNEFNLCEILLLIQVQQIWYTKYVR